jgi:SAM-dependent methyltransferase
VNAAGPFAGLRTRAARVGGQIRFRGSKSYWEQRYAGGGDSGAGSYGAQAQWKADVVNGWVESLGVGSVVDLGCGDGNQLSLARYPRYLGLDVSATAIQRCAERFASDPTKSFLAYDPAAFQDSAGWLRADLALSMEVLFHLVERDVFEAYLVLLFGAAERYVVVCARDAELRGGPHERYRPFTPWVAEQAPEWELVERVEPPIGVDLVSDLFLFARRR